MPFIQPPVGKLITFFEIAPILIAINPIPNIAFDLLLDSSDFILILVFLIIRIIRNILWMSQSALVRLGSKVFQGIAESRSKLAQSHLSKCWQ